MRAFVFMGPTITPAEARTWLEAEYLPPVSQGDVASLLRFEPDVIGIIDGYFDQVPSAWHKEFLLALAQGVTVVGASSMGALRAAELHPFGMVGVGQVFEWYRDGVIEADDEVAIRHAPAEFNYRPLSEAMVNIRSTLIAACRAGLLTEPTRDALIELGRATPYWERSYVSLLAAGARAGLPPDELAALKDYAAVHAIDQKKEDAVAMLRYVAVLEGTARAPGPGLDVQRTIFLNRLLDRDLRIEPPGGGGLATLAELADYARLGLPDFREVMQKTAARKLHIDYARRLGFRVSEEELAQEIERFRAQRTLTTEEDLQTWLAGNALTGAEFRAHLEGMALEAKLLKMYAAPENRDVLWQLRLEGRFETLSAALREREASRLEGGAPRTLAPEELLESYRAQTGGDWPKTLDEAVEGLGFADEHSLLLELQKAYQNRIG